MKKLPFVSILMPVRNEGKFMERSLGAVLSQDYPSHRMEIIVSDGMSTDETRSVIEGFQKKYANLRIIDNPKKIVPPGLNEAIRQATGDIIVRVDGHCEIEKDYVSQCVELLEKSSAAGVGGPIYTVGETYIAQAISAAMSSWFGVGGVAFRTIKEGELEVETVPFPAYRKELFGRVGVFDEELVRNQDDEFNYRLRSAGFKIIFSSKIKSKYYSRGTLKSLWKQYFQYGYWKVRVMQKHPRQMKLRHFIPAVFVAGTVLAWILSVVIPASAPIIRAIAGTYFLLSLIFSGITAIDHGWKFFPIFPLIYLILHSAYGVGFIVGLFRFSW